MFISLRGERQKVTKILNWATDWPVLIEGEQRGGEEVGKSRALGGTEGNRGLLLLTGTGRHFCIV